MQIIRWARITVIVVVCVASLPAIGQISLNDPGNPLLARLSYVNTSALHGQSESGRSCFAVLQDGRYRIMHVNLLGDPYLLEGTLSTEQLRQFRYILDTPDFVALAENQGRIVREYSETFIAEVPRAKGTQRLIWMIPDGESAFPKTIQDVMRWLETFRPTSANKPRDVDFPEVCPAVGLSPTRPT